tara:strand:- start:7778 stop:8914 length:1137 start_codon:yes stop_codon:yes gene_type:complete
MITLKDLYTGGVSPGISQGMKWAGQAQNIDTGRARNRLLDLQTEYEPTRQANQNRLAELGIQGKEQAISQNEQKQGVTNLDLLRRALEGQGPISEIQDDETANQRYRVAQSILGQAGVDLNGMPEAVTAQELQAVGGINGAAGNTGVQSTFTTDDGKLGLVFRDGRREITDTGVQRSYQARDYGDRPFIFDSKSGQLMPVGGAAGDAALSAADQQRQAEVQQTRQEAMAKEGAKAEAAQGAQARESSRVLGMLEQMEALVQQGVYGGGILDRAGRIAAGAGVPFDEERAARTQQLRQMATELKLQAKPPGMGAMSDSEWQILKEAIPNPDAGTPEQILAGIEQFRRTVQARMEQPIQQQGSTQRLRYNPQTRELEPAQ